MTTILVTGGLGYIGAHSCVALKKAGFDIVIIDNLANSKLSVRDRLAAIVGAPVPFYRMDIRDRAGLDTLFREHRIDAVMHFAALKSVSESVARPLDYYDTNVSGTATLLQAMQQAGVFTFVFSSSATVYGNPQSVPIREDFPRAAVNPYGRTKIIIEDMLNDLAASDPVWRVALLRYFNPIGAHDSALIGEDPHGIPANLMPYLLQVAVGQRSHVNVYGADYPTRDGTGVRDYIHVMDLAEGHVVALDYLLAGQRMLTVNLGTGQSTSVLELLASFKAATGVAVPYEITARRPGDVAECWSDPALAARLLGWRTQRDLAAMCASSWAWQSKNPDGYP